jgi:hypothetical protein
LKILILTNNLKFTHALIHAASLMKQQFHKTIESNVKVAIKFRILKVFTVLILIKHNVKITQNPLNNVLIQTTSFV